MTLDLDKLEALAKAAPQGKWEIWTSNSWRRVMASGAFRERPGTMRVIEPTVQHFDNHPDLMFGPGVEAWMEGFTPEVALALIAEVRALREDAAMFRLLTSTCDALDANSFDASNQPGTIRMTLKHKTRTYPELEMKIIDFLLGYKARVEAAEKEPT